MSFAELLFLLLSKRKSLIKFALGSSITYGAYAGAIRPSIGSSVTEVDGANILQGKQKDSINLAKSRITNVDNVLELTSLKNLEQNQHKFHPSLSKYLVNNKISEKQEWSWLQVNNGTIKEATDSWGYCRECSALSDKEIIYGESYFSRRIADFKESELVQDILWSLWEESRYSGTLIHAETIKADLKIHKVNKVPEVNQFSLSFKVSNFTGRKAKVFRTIELESNTETEVNILLSNSQLRPTPVVADVQGIKYAAWNLFPKNKQWKVVKNLQQPRKQTVTESHDSLQLVFGSSRFIPFSISRDVSQKVAVNSIDYSYIKENLNPYLNSITAQTVKKDIESWYGGHVAYLLRTRIEDIQEIINLMQKKTIENDRGIKESIFERTLNSFQFRNNLYHHFKFNENFKKIFDRLLTNTDKSNETVRIKIQEVIGLLKSWVAQLKAIQDSIKVEIKWNKIPERVYSEAGQNGQFPHFAFNFEQKITWVKDMNIPLKGTWNNKKNEYEQATQEAQTGDDKYSFDITNKLTNIKQVLLPLTSTIGSLGQGLPVNIMDDLLPDVGKFIGIDSLKISNGESISYIYQTTGTPITLALEDTSDLQQKYFPKMNIGWKALDVSAGLNLSNFTKLFYSIYEKFDLGVPNKESLGIQQLMSAKQELFQSPISFVAHAINSIFDETYELGKRAKRQDEKKRPWPVFFQTLLGDTLTFAHSQMMVGYSSLFFEYEKWWGVENKLNKSKDCKDSTPEAEAEAEAEAWCTNFDFSKKGAIAKPINKELELISSSLVFNHSTFMPDAPIVIDGFGNGKQYEKFLARGAIGDTSQGLLNSKNKIIEVVKDSYEKNFRSFEGKRVINWDNTKVSFAQLNLKKAINSLLTLPNTWSGWSASALALSVSGIEFHKILGEALLRDGFWINVNLMHEYGMFTKHDLKVTKKMTYFPNSEIWLKVSPDLDYKKLNLGNLNSWLGI